MRRVAISIVLALGACGKPASSVKRGAVASVPLEAAVVDAAVVDAAVDAAVDAVAAPVRYAGALAVSVDWGNAYSMSVGFHQHADVYEVDEHTLEKLVLRMEQTAADGSKRVVWQRDGFAAISGLAARPKVLEVCEYRAALTKIDLDGPGARLSIACRNGEDMFTASEFAMLLEVSDPRVEPFPPLWVGDADFHSDENGACIKRKTVGFKLSKTTLVQNIVDETQGNNGKDCKPGQRRGKLTTTRRTVKTEVQRRAPPATP